MWVSDGFEVSFEMWDVGVDDFGVGLEVLGGW